METSFDTRTRAGEDSEDHVSLLPMPRRDQRESRNKDDLPRIGHSPFVRPKVQAVGIWNMILLSAGFLIGVALSGFLGFLWSTRPDCDLDSSSCRLWRSIVLSGPAALSTAVTISSAVLRTTLSLQAGVALSMVAALAIESVAGVPIEFVPLVLTLRGLSASVYQLLVYIWATFRSAPLYNMCVLFLIMTALASQFASTLLILSNLGPEFVVGEPVKTEGYLGVSVTGDVDFDHHLPQYWFGSTREYPTFAESSSSQNGNSASWKSDTGPTLRAFLPVRDSEERRLLDSFDGYSQVWDTRFTCMPVNIMGSITKGTESFSQEVYMGGNLSVPLPSHMRVKKGYSGAASQVLSISHFNCSLAFPAMENPGMEWAMTICSVFDPTTQLRLSMESPLVSPDEPEINATTGRTLGPSPPRQYLVINTTGLLTDWQSALNKDVEWKFAIEDPWRTASAPVAYSWSIRNTTYNVNTTLTVAISYCATSLVSAVVPVSMKRGRNNSRAEPVAELNNDNRYKNSSNQQGVASLYAGAIGGDSLSARGVLELEPRVAAAGGGWPAGRALADTIMGVELASVKLEDINEGAGRQGGGVGVSVGLCSRRQLYPQNSFRAHKDHVAVFQHILQSKAGSLPLAMQTVWTILAQMAYYDNFPDFNVQREASIASFRRVLVPIGVNGLVFVIAIILIQNVTIALIVVLFFRRTRLSFVGNLWQGFGQLAASDMSGLALRTTVASDKEVLSQLEKDGVRTTSVSLVYDVQGKVSRLESRDKLG